MVEPVIVIPGITATYLKDEYPVDNEYLWKVIKKDYKRITLHPNNPKYEAIEPARVVHDQIYEVAYKELIEELRHNLKESDDKEVPVYPFGYDWRMPLEDAEDKLDQFIDEVIERTLLTRHYYNEEEYKEKPKVNLIGHSMGGLIIAGYIQKRGATKVNKVVTLATPFRGSYEAALKITTGYADLGTATSKSSEREAARMTPSLYYLLPDFDNAIESDHEEPVSLFNTDSWQPSVLETIEKFITTKGLPTRTPKEDAGKLFSKLLGDAQSHRDRINKFKLTDAGLDKSRWMAVVGVDSKTRINLHITKMNGAVYFDLQRDDRKNEWGNGDQENQKLTGDGTVPFKGALPTFLSKENLICITPGDYGYWEIQDRALSKVAGFHGILPNMNMLHRLIVRFLKDKEDPKGSTWGRRAPGIEDWKYPLKGELREKTD